MQNIRVIIKNISIVFRIKNNYIKLVITYIKKHYIIDKLKI